ncbi:acyltransferase domain-containing protein [Mycobacterium yunnanensis]|uniref:[acyl-carrier-protein] S-malonyltransferase n=1 Tax=Mycobacterium yunnanensis TaxID=368477 RepID=A0A9X3BU91_9MYCO|nr:acyltransferase domain-containing protein [Mycobacterium yunnanensis]MCV7422449.1 acyltransferase domain-containing protein [Mycobacterium yunnanensis]
MSVALLFPGQGSQYPHMLRDLPTSPAVTVVLDESDWSIEDLDSADGLASTVDVQIALLIAGVASARAFVDEHGLTPEFVAGHSVGAFAAAVTAGVLTLAEALAAVELRGRSMEQACAQGDWGMAAVRGLPTRAAAELVRRVATADDPLWVANVNGATQTVVSGTGAALDRAADAARDAGAQSCERLDVAVASHCPLQQATADLMAAHLARLPRRRATRRYLTNTTGRVTTSAEVVLDDLAQSVARPVQWYDGTRLLGELGVTAAVETAPGHVLTRLLASAVPSIRAVSVTDDGFETCARLAMRE